MIKTIEIVSLSSGIIGESLAAHELKIGVERLQARGLTVKFSKHALKGIDYIKEHPENRAADLIEAYADPEVDMILCAIGGDDTFRLLPYLFEDDRLKNVVSGVLVGKPMDETYADEYKKLLVKIIDSPELPVLCNINIGHATPRCIIPFGINATVDADNQVITFE